MVLILTYKERNKKCPPFTELILGKKVDSLAKRKAIKIFLIVIPFLHAVIILTSDFFAEKYSHSTVKSFVSMLGIIMSLC